MGLHSVAFACMQSLLAGTAPLWLQSLQQKILASIHRLRQGAGHAPAVPGV